VYESAIGEWVGCAVGLPTQINKKTFPMFGIFPQSFGSTRSWTRPSRPVFVMARVRGQKWSEGKPLPHNVRVDLQDAFGKCTTQHLRTARMMYQGGGQARG
jgi:hypothetical protein